DPQHVLEHNARTPRGLQRLGKDDVIEGVVGVVRKVGIGIALDDRETFCDALVHSLAGKLDAAPVDTAGLGQEAQQLAVAATYVEHLGARRHHLGDHQQVDARAARAASRLRHGEIVLEPGEHGYRRPRALAAPSRKPHTISNSSGSSSRNASWPLSVTISAKETRAPPALRACTMAR